ncbi:MAG: hypothetical protein IIU34_00385, partial [Bacteroidales bacterium]|nr:hypothetical protein [Bacteroidales bacterium]
MSEIFDAVRYVIEQSGYASKLTSGVVITGGSSHLENILQLAGALLGQRIRLAAPQNAIEGNSVEDAFDVYAATAVGLVLETIDPLLSHALEFRKETVAQPAKTSESSLFGKEDEEEEEIFDARAERERRKEEERKAKELRKQQDALRKQQEAERKAREKAEKKKEKSGPSFFDLLFSDSDNNNA